jgi:hypothetical protein
LADDSGNKTNQFLALNHHFQIGVAGSVPFQKCEFRQVHSAPFLFAETPAYLKYPGISGAKEPFHAEFRGGMQKPSIGLLSINMGFWRRGRNPDRGFDFKIIVLNKEQTSGLKDFGSSNQIPADEMLSVMRHGHD